MWLETCSSRRNTQKTADQTEEVNWEPRSDVKTDGTPNPATQEKRNALTQDSAGIELNEATSGHQGVLSIMVRR